MTESGNPKDNARAERVNSTMKDELFKGVVFHNIEEVKAAVSVAIDFYNNERPHMSIDMMTPAEAADCSGEIAGRWTSYRLIAIKNQAESLNIAGNSLPLQSCSGSPYGLRPPVNPEQG
jgi:hypothetical protein